MSDDRSEHERQLAQDLLDNSTADAESRLLAHAALRILDISERVTQIAADQGRLADAVIALEAAHRRDQERFNKLVDALEKSYQNGSRPSLHAVRAPVGDEE